MYIYFVYSMYIFIIRHFLNFQINFYNYFLNVISPFLFDVIVDWFVERFKYWLKFGYIEIRLVNNLFNESFYYCWQIPFTQVWVYWKYHIFGKIKVLNWILWKDDYCFTKFTKSTWTKISIIVKITRKRGKSSCETYKLARNSF